MDGYDYRQQVRGQGISYDKIVVFKSGVHLSDEKDEVKTGQ